MEQAQEVTAQKSFQLSQDCNLEPTLDAFLTIDACRTHERVENHDGLEGVEVEVAVGVGYCDHV
jgi:hypothetical protein